MKVLITGAGGMLGGDMATVAQAMGHQVVAVDRSELDVSDESAVEAKVREVRPEAIVNCAAWTDVDGAESNEEEATLINGRGAANLAASSAAVKAKICQISTDYVFDGSKQGAYVESDPTAPIQAYGRSKLAGEEAVRVANPDHFIVRTSWLFGPANQRPNFVETMLRIGSSGEPVTVVHDQHGCPTYTGHLARGVIELIDGISFGTHHMAGSGSCSWFGFAEEIFRQAEMEANLVPTDSSGFARPAKRPANSVLVSEWETPIVLPEWQSGLDEYLRRRGEPESIGAAR